MNSDGPLPAVRIALDELLVLPLAAEALRGMIGVAGALALGRVTQSLLFGVTPTDPLTFVGVGMVILLVALLACLLPAQRAMRVDPLVAIRSD